eukprot:11139750-Heterocapsa_arctica.AAC.1
MGSKSIACNDAGASPNFFHSVVSHGVRQKFSLLRFPTLVVMFARISQFSADDTQVTDPMPLDQQSLQAHVDVR